MEFFKKYWKSITLTLIVIFLCSLPGNKVDEVKFIDIPHLDKIVHFGMYFCLSFILIFDNRKVEREKSRNIKLFSFFYCLFLGISLEILQKYVFFERGFEISDIIANTLGILFGILLSKPIMVKVLKYHQ